MATTKYNTIKTWTLTALSLCPSELSKTNWGKETLPKLIGGESWIFFAILPLELFIWFIDYSHWEGNFDQFPHWFVHRGGSHWGAEPWVYSKMSVWLYHQKGPVKLSSTNKRQRCRLTHFFFFTFNKTFWQKYICSNYHEKDL